MKATHLNDRQKYIGSSDVAAILGISPWRTPLDVYLDKIQPRAEETDPAKLRVLTRGKRMEPYVIDLLSEETGLEIVARGNRYTDPDLPFIAAEIDAEAASGENIEIKTVSPFKAREWGEQFSDEIPLHYAAQVMHALMVTGKDICVLGVLIGADDFRTYRIERDDITIQAIREKEIEFWDRLQKQEPPEATTVDDVLRLYGKDAGSAVSASDAIEDDYFALKRLKDEAAEIKALIDEREGRIKLYMADAATLLIKGTPVLTWKTQVSNRLDSKSLKATHPALYSEFTKQTESRVFRIK